MVQGTGKMVRLSECSSYRGFELSSDFYEKVLVKVQRELKNSSSYWKFEFPGARVVGSVLYKMDSVRIFVVRFLQAVRDRFFLHRSHVKLIKIIFSVKGFYVQSRSSFSCRPSK